MVGPRPGRRPGHAHRQRLKLDLPRMDHRPARPRQQELDHQRRRRADAAAPRAPSPPSGLLHPRPLDPARQPARNTAMREQHDLTGIAGGVPQHASGCPRSRPGRRCWTGGAHSRRSRRSRPGRPASGGPAASNRGRASSRPGPGSAPSGTRAGRALWPRPRSAARTATARRRSGCQPAAHHRRRRVSLQRSARRGQAALLAEPGGVSRHLSMWFIAACRPGRGGAGVLAGRALPAGLGVARQGTAGRFHR